MPDSSLQDFSQHHAVDCGDKVAVIPVSREILADLETPVSAFLKARDSAYSFLLESAADAANWGRYSVIGMDPEFIVRATGTRCELWHEDKCVVEQDRGDPLSFLEEEMARYQEVGAESLPPYGGGGVIGWLGFDAVRWWERLPSPHPSTASNAPTMVFFSPRTLLIFDNRKHRIHAVRLVFRNRTVDAETAFRKASRELDRVVERLRAPLAYPSGGTGEGPAAARSIGSEEAYKARVTKIKKYIEAGDCIQVVPSHRFELEYSGPPVDFYRALRAVNPSPYMYHLCYPELTVVGASPETLVRVENDSVRVAPIAGTRWRGKTPEEDQRIAEELLSDPKELAEHVMLVDLARNDLGRVSEPGTVQVENFQHIERYSHVMHIVSDVHGRLRKDKTRFDALRSTFPAGTLSGAPKIRAMEIIDELEEHSRDLYGGAVGYIGFGKKMDLCIAIRTAWQKDGNWVVQVGGGIVADSDPSAEYQETVNKVGALVRALELARGGL